MGYGSKCNIWYGQVDYIENSKLNIADKWLISLDHVTYVMRSSKMSLYVAMSELYYVENPIKIEHSVPEI